MIGAAVFFAFPYEFDQSQPEYRVALKQCVEAEGFRPLFADEKTSPNHVLMHVADCIDECEIGFYDITGLNPNVLIEFGLGYASEKPCFLLINETAHLKQSKSFWGSKTELLPIPADLNGILLYKYTSTENLRAVVSQVVKQNLVEKIRSGQAMANQIIDRLKRRGPANMSTIARDINQPIDEVRPILRSLVAVDKVHKEGRARGTKYRADS